MNHAIVLPSVYPLWTERCLRDCRMEAENSELLIVHNEVHNIGVARSWNFGIDEMLATDAKWLVILSAATRFGPPGGLDFLEALDGHPEAVAVEAAHGIGWHLIAFPRWVIERVGRFDENFFAYMEDLDLARRISLAFGLDPPYWTKVSVDVAIAGFSHGIDLAGVRPDQRRQQDYYRAKWDCVGGETQGHESPFGDSSKGLDWWPVPPDPRSIL